MSTTMSLKTAKNTYLFSSLAVRYYTRTQNEMLQNSLFQGINTLRRCKEKNTLLPYYAINSIFVEYIYFFF